MITLIGFILLENFTESYNGWLFVLPVLLDLIVLDKLEIKL